jgi:unsaturated rhamnogalacturonyl hydrolase
MSQYRYVLLMLIAALAASMAFGADAPTTLPTTRPPQYPVPYGTPTTQAIKETLTHVRLRLESAVPPAPFVGSPAQIDWRHAPISYPMGVVYAGMLSAAQATGDKAYSDFVADRLQFYADNLAKGEHEHLRYFLAPNSLDACGAIGSALVKARRAGVGPDLKPVIDRFAEYVSHGQFRLDDGTLARNRPFKNSLWGDDMYMSVPFLAQMGALTGERRYYDDAVKQIVQMSQRLFIPSAGFFTHAWNAGNPDDHPHYYWGRANGWCMMAMVELLDVLPADHPGREQILHILRSAAQGIATAQSGTGLWHQMLDRPDSYLETSCSAMFTYALARAVNRGWLDASAYGPVAQAGWNGVTSKINSNGCISGICIGTSYADDYVYYYARPATDDIHGYGPVLLAGSEMIRLLENNRIRNVYYGGNPVYYLDRKRDTAPTQNQP